jgi:hypothetical protein
VDDTVVEFEVLNFCQRGCSAKSTKEATYCNNNLASRLNATGNDCIAFFVQVDGNDLSAYGVKGFKSAWCLRHHLEFSLPVTLLPLTSPSSTNPE